MTDLEQLIQRTPNDSELGRRVRERYRATVNNSESTNATSHSDEIQMELDLGSRGQQEHDLKIQSAKQAFKDYKEMEEKKDTPLDINLAYTSARTTPHRY